MSHAAHRGREPQLKELTLESGVELESAFHASSCDQLASWRLLVDGDVQKL